MSLSPEVVVVRAVLDQHAGRIAGVGLAGGLIRSPQLRLLFVKRLWQAVTVHRQVFEVWEKSLSSITLSSELTRPQASQTWLALFLRNVE